MLFSNASVNFADTALLTQFRLKSKRQVFKIFINYLTAAIKSGSLS